MTTDSVVITCAITGAGRRQSGNPNLPYTPDEYGNEAGRAAAAGATVIHIHGRDPRTGTPSHDVEHFRDAVAAIRAAAPDVLINISTGGSAPVADRAAPVAELRPEVATVGMGSATYAAVKDGRISYEVVLTGLFGDISHLVDTMCSNGVVPEFECYEAGHVDNLAVAADLGIPMERGHVAFVLGVTGAMAADARHLDHLSALLDERWRWTAVVVDPARHWDLLASAAGAGGWIRVGFEDSPWLDAGTMATSNGALVERAVRLCHDAGRPVADAATTRALIAGH